MASNPPGRKERGVVALAVSSLVAGAVAIGFAVVSGQATVALVVIFPVFVGHSPLFLAGVALVVGGLFGWVLLPARLDHPAEPLPREGEPTERRSGSGGIVLVGPIPIVWGSAGALSRRARWGLAIAGGALLAVGIVVFLGLR